MNVVYFDLPLLFYVIHDLHTLNTTPAWNFHQASWSQNIILKPKTEEVKIDSLKIWRSQSVKYKCEEKLVKCEDCEAEPPWYPLPPPEKKFVLIEFRYILRAMIFPHQNTKSLIFSFKWLKSVFCCTWEKDFLRTLSVRHICLLMIFIGKKRKTNYHKYSPGKSHIQQLLIQSIKIHGGVWCTLEKTLQLYDTHMHVSLRQICCVDVGLVLDSRQCPAKCLWSTLLVSAWIWLWLSLIILTNMVWQLYFLSKFWADACSCNLCVFVILNQFNTISAGRLHGCCMT